MILATEAQEFVAKQKTSLAANILIVSERDDAVDMQEFLESCGYQVSRATNAISTLETFDRNNPEIVLLEASFAEVSPKGICELLRAKCGNRDNLSIIVYAGGIEQEFEEIAFECEADDFLRSSLSERELIWRLEKQIRAVRQNRALTNDNREAAFLADLGRSLLVTLEPEQGLTRVAAATYEVTDAAICSAAALVAGNSLTVSVFTRDGSAEGASEVYSERLKDWLQTEGCKPELVTDCNRFLLKDEHHAVEYVSPMVVGDRTKGALVVGFDRAEECTPENQSLIDQAAELSALSVQITSLYDAALDASVYLVQEEQKRFTEAILDALPLSLYAIDRDYRIVAWNRHREIGKQGMPREAALGRNVFDVLPRQPREILEREFERAFVTGQIESVEQKTTDERGQIKHWLVSKIPMRDQMTGEVTHVISVGEDITGRVEANHAVARAEKLAAVGRLAAGVVHEINNPLATISACAEALESRAEEGAFGSSEDVDDLREYLELIRSEAFRCKTITHGLLDFSRARTGHRTPVNLAEVVRSSANLVRHQKRGQKIDIYVEADDNLPLVGADEGQLQQAVIALATNAIDAMPDGGRLTFRAYARRQRVFLEVEDSGIGIHPENIAKIFEPFFTTKEVGQGTGLGLAVCYGIVTEHGGSLNVRSTLGIGSTFTVSLPITN